VLGAIVKAVGHSTAALCLVGDNPIISCQAKIKDVEKTIG
jgi:hypothetical protein